MARARFARSPFVALSYTRGALFAVAAAALLLQLIGIHNAWDAVAYDVFVNTRDNDAESGRETISDRDLP
jgi:hypothetical protein